MWVHLKTFQSQGTYKNRYANHVELLFQMWKLKNWQIEEK